MVCTPYITCGSLGKGYFNSCCSSCIEKYVFINLIWGPSQIITQKGLVPEV